MAKKLFRGFEGYHENALIQSFEMSPLLICWEFRSKTFNGQPLDWVWIRLAIKGFGPELSTYQVAAHFEALDEGVLMVPLKSSEQFFRHFNFPCRTVYSFPKCTTTGIMLCGGRKMFWGFAHYRWKFLLWPKSRDFTPSLFKGKFTPSPEHSWPCPPLDHWPQNFDIAHVLASLLLTNFWHLSNLALAACFKCRVSMSFLSYCAAAVKVK